MSNNDSNGGGGEVLESGFLEHIKSENTTLNTFSIISNLKHKFENIDLSKEIDVEIDFNSCEDLLNILIALNNKVSGNIPFEYKPGISTIEILRFVKMLVLSLNQINSDGTTSNILLEDEQFNILYSTIELIETIKIPETNRVSNEITSIMENNG